MANLGYTNSNASFCFFRWLVCRLVVSTPLTNISQFGMIDSQLNGKIMFQTINQYIYIFIYLFIYLYIYIYACAKSQLIVAIEPAESPLPCPNRLPYVCQKIVAWKRRAFSPCRAQCLASSHFLGNLGEIPWIGGKS